LSWFNIFNLTNIVISTLLIAVVEDLTAEVVSNAASYTVTCKYKGTDNPTVSWIVAGKTVSDSDPNIDITPGSLTGNER
jgi:hypothetical protein